MNPTLTQNLYSRLDIERTVTPSEVKKAYRRMAMKYHPDRNPENSEQAHKDFLAISEAFEVLSDSTKIIGYDRNQTIDSHRTRHQSRREAPSASKKSREEDTFNFYNTKYKDFFKEKIIKDKFNLENIIITKEFYRFNNIKKYS